MLGVRCYTKLNGVNDRLAPPLSKWRLGGVNICRVNSLNWYNNNNPDRSIMWMGAAMLACCAVPIIIALSLGGGLGAFFGSANRSSKLKLLRSILQRRGYANKCKNSTKFGINLQSISPHRFLIFLQYCKK